MTCLICNRRKGYPICVICGDNPFLLEKARQILATNRDYKKLKTMYSNKYPEIKNLNTSKFWDVKLDKIHPLQFEGGMTKDRILQSFKFIPKDAKKILDIGAGYGFVEEFLSKNSKEVYANDFSKEAIKNLRQRFKGKFKVESIYKMRYKPNTFDCVLALEVLEHIPPSKILNVLKKIKQLLKKQGTFILSIPTNEGLENMRDNPNGHLRLYTKELIKFELEIAGFEVKSIRTFYAFSKYYNFKKILSHFIAHWEPNDIVVLAKSL